MSAASSQHSGAEPHMLSAQSLAEYLNAEFRPAPGHNKDDPVPIHSAATLQAAQSDQLSFLANPNYREHLSTTQAATVILSETMLADCPTAAIVSDDPYLSWAKALSLLHPPQPIAAGISAQTSIDPSATIDANARVEAMCHIAAGVNIGADAYIGAGSIIEQHASIGDGSRLVGKVYLGENVKLGQRVIVHPGAVIGADGFGLAMDQGRWRKIPQLGSVVIGNDCEIGANTTIDRGALDDTVLGNGVRLDNQVQIAHNVQIGDHTAIAGCVGVAGSTRIGRYCMIAGASGIGGHLTICDQVVITAMSTVLHSIDEAGTYGSGIPAKPMRNWQRTLVRLGQLDRWMRRKK